MKSHELSLIFFTLFAQMSWGLLVAFALPGVIQHKGAKAVTSVVRRPVILVSAFLITAALVISFFHLGSPMKAVYAFANTGSSWLSREILSAAVFWAVLLAWSGTLYLKAMDRAGNILLFAGIFAGLIMVYTMTRLYMLPSIPPWDSYSTMAVFFTSGLMLGPALLILVNATVNDPGPDGMSTWNYNLIVVALLLMSLIARLLTVPVIDAPVEEVVFAPAPLPVWVGVLHYFLLVTGVAMMMICLFLQASRNRKRILIIPVLGFLFIFLAEVVLRYMFYAGYYRLGL